MLLKTFLYNVTAALPARANYTTSTHASCYLTDNLTQTNMTRRPTGRNATNKQADFTASNDRKIATSTQASCYLTDIPAQANKTNTTGRNATNKQTDYIARDDRKIASDGSLDYFLNLSCFFKANHATK